MARTVRIQRRADALQLRLKEHATPASKRAVIGRFARTRLGAAQQHNAAVLGRVPDHEQYVDGRRGAAFETVKTNGGRIVIQFELLDEVLAEIGRMLVEESPVWKGDYIKGHRLFADGVEVPAGTDLPPADEYVYLNLVPYARRLEIGRKRDGTPFVTQVEPRIYERVFKRARRRFGNIVKLKYVYRSPHLGYVALGGRRGGKTASAATRDAHNFERATRAPAILISSR